MPRIIDYSEVLQRMTAAGFHCNYPNSGAFGFSPAAIVLFRGWIGPADSTIRPALAVETRPVQEPYEKNLAAAAGRVWKNVLPGVVWVMPLSHWHFEMHDGSREWLPGVLREIQVEAKQLEERADGSAIEFSDQESALLERLVEALLGNLKASDFLLAFPGQSALCTVHHHKQLWWVTTDAKLLAAIDAQFMPAPVQ